MASPGKRKSYIILISSDEDDIVTASKYAKMSVDLVSDGVLGANSTSECNSNSYVCDGSDSEEMDLGRKVESDDDACDFHEDSMKSLLKSELFQSGHEERQRQLRLWHNSPIGRSQRFVDEVRVTAAELGKDLGDTRYKVDFVSRDYVIEFCTKLLYKQQAFARTHGKTNVTIGYHWTSAANMPEIQLNGLLTRDDQSAHCVTPHVYHGEAFGRGIYTGNNPFSFSMYGKVGLLCAVLHGQKLNPKTTRPGDSHGCDTRIGFCRNQPLNTQIILESSDQIAPVWSFVPELLTTETGRELLWSYHEALSKAIESVLNQLPEDLQATATPPPTHTNQVIDVDALDCAPGPVPVQTPMPTDTDTDTAVTAPGAILPEITLEQWNHHGATHSTAPQNRLRVVNQPLSGLVGTLSGLVSTPRAPTHSPPSGTVVYTCPISLASLHSNPYQRVRAQDISSEPCMVCLEDLAQTQMPHEPDTTTSASDRTSIDVDGDQNQERARVCVALKACAHQYHEGCLTAALANSMTCAICRAPVSQGMRGTQPSGTMQYKTSKFNHCLGYESVGIVTITYTFTAGVQRQYHPSPGVKHRGARRIAYLPDNRDGRMLLNRLLYAFETDPKNSFEQWQTLRKERDVVTPLPTDRFLCSFSHIFAGGYSSGYFSYKWAEVLSQDAYESFAEASTSEERIDTGARFRDTVLSLGGSVAPSEVFESFKGREPNTTALLKTYGLDAVASTA